MCVDYEIRIEGHLDPSWFEWSEKMVVEPLPDGTTRLFGPMPDQTALHGLLNRIRDLNLKLISVEKKEEA